MASKIRNGAIETVEEASQETTERTEAPADVRDMTSILEDTVAITREEVTEPETAEESTPAPPLRRARRLMRSRRTLAALIVGAVAVGVLAGMVLRARASAAEPDPSELLSA